MDRAALIRKLEGMLDEAERNRMYGKIEIEFVAGRATYIRKMEAEKLENEASHDRLPRYK